MSRIVRIAFTLFISATILTLLVRQRALRLEENLRDATGPVAEELTKAEGPMIAMGLLLAGILAAGGFVLIIAMVRNRKAANRHEG